MSSGRHRAHTRRQWRLGALVPRLPSGARDRLARGAAGLGSVLTAFAVTSLLMLTFGPQTADTSAPTATAGVAPVTRALLASVDVGPQLSHPQSNASGASLGVSAHFRSGS
jgi:hypothetical protein